MRFGAVKFSDSECLILRMPSLRKFRCYSLLAFVQNKATVYKVLWSGNVRGSWVSCHIVMGEIFVSRTQHCLGHYVG